MNYGDNLRSEEKIDGINGGLNRRMVSASLHNGIDSELSDKKSAKGKAEREKLFGRDSVNIVTKRQEGINDRINGIPYDDSKYDDEYDRNNYHEGFFVMGNRVLYGQIEKLSAEQLQKIGANDYISGVDLKTLPQPIKDNSSYAQGYLMASIMSESKGKSRR